MTREEHMNWCKQRAREYLDQGDIPNAITSMLSDLTMHPDTRASGEGIVMTLSELGGMAGNFIFIVYKVEGRDVNFIPLKQAVIIL